ncbi:MAG: hypothetical protein HKN03_14175 [Acidimicrobiales bacterium]|nr:hypothetical protein [Acidimicrobiales bacterium]
MSKLYEPRTPHRDEVKDIRDTQEVLPDLPADVTVPDDARGITHPRRFGGGRAATGIRWIRWMPAMLLLVAGAVALGLALRGDSADTANEPWVTVTAGPGSNSLAPTPFEAVQVDAITHTYTSVPPTDWATDTYGTG